MCNTQTSLAIFELNKLPAEVVCRVMFHTPIDDLKSLIAADQEVKDLFEANRSYIFKGIQRVQFSEFEGLFGEVPAFQSTRRHPPPPACTQTVNQAQNLKDAVSSTEWGESEDDLCSPPLSSEDVFKKLCQKGGWDYLQLLEYLQDRSDPLLEDLKSVGFRMYSQEQTDLRAAMLTIQRMHWRRKGESTGMSPLDSGTLHEFLLQKSGQTYC